MLSPRFIVPISIWAALVTFASAQPPEGAQRIPVVVPNQLGVGAGPRKVTLIELLKLPAIGIELKLTDADRKRLQDVEKTMDEHKSRWGLEVRARLKQLADVGDKEALEAAREGYLEEWG